MLPPRPKHTRTPLNAHAHVQQRFGTARPRFDFSCALSRRALPFPASRHCSPAPPQVRPAPPMPTPMPRRGLEPQGRGSILPACLFAAPIERFPASCSNPAPSKHNPTRAHAHVQQRFGTARPRFDSSCALSRHTPRSPAPLQVRPARPRLCSRPCPAEAWNRKVAVRFLARALSPHPSLPSLTHVPAPPQARPNPAQCSRPCPAEAWNCKAAVRFSLHAFSSHPPRFPTHCCSPAPDTPSPVHARADAKRKLGTARPWFDSPCTLSHRTTRSAEPRNRKAAVRFSLSALSSRPSRPSHVLYVHPKHTQPTAMPTRMSSRGLEPQGRGSIPPARYFAAPLASHPHACSRPAPNTSKPHPMLTPMTSRGLEPQGCGSIFPARSLVAPFASQLHAIAPQPRPWYAQPHSCPRPCPAEAWNRKVAVRFLLRAFSPHPSLPRFMLQPRPKQAQPHPCSRPCSA